MEGILNTLRERLASIPVLAHTSQLLTMDCVEDMFSEFYERALRNNGLPDVNYVSTTINDFIQCLLEHPSIRSGMASEVAPPATLYRDLSGFSELETEGIPDEDMDEEPSERSPFDLLSTEVITAIFQRGAKDQNDFLFLVSGVCRRWRTIAISTPSLWSNIVVCGLHSLKTCPLYLERSSTAPLRVYVHCLPLGHGEDHPEYFNDALDLILPHLERIRSFTIRTLTVEGMSWTLRALAAVAEETRRKLPLYRLDLGVCCPPWKRPDARDLRWAIPMELRGLREITFDRVPFLLISELRRLQHLCITRPHGLVSDIGDVYWILSRCPSLATFEFEIHASDFQHYSVAGSDEIIHLPQLERLVYRYGDRRVLISILQSIHAPRLAHLQANLAADLGDEIDAAIDSPFANSKHGALLLLISKLTTVQTLVLGRCRFTNPDLFRTLECLPNLQKLSISSCPVTDYVFDKLASPEITESWPCRQLYALELSNCRSFTAGSLKQLVESRHWAAEHGCVSRITVLNISACERFTEHDAAACRMRVPNVQYRHFAPYTGYSF